jgi:hypothetical protein
LAIFRYTFLFAISQSGILGEIMSDDLSENKLVIILGDFVHEGVKAVIDSYNFNYSIRKVMHRTEKLLDQ